MKCRFLQLFISLCFRIYQGLSIGTERKSRPRDYKKKSLLTQLIMEFFLLVNVKISTNAGILTFMNRKNSTVSLYEPEKRPESLDIFILMSI